MPVFDTQFTEAERVNTTKWSRWHLPNDDSHVAKPSWPAMDRDGRELVVPQTHDLPADSPDRSIPAPISVFAFGEADLAKAAASGVVQGYAQGWQAREQAEADRLVALVESIAGEIHGFLGSVQLPLEAIRAQLSGLLGEIVERLSLPADDAERRELISNGIEHCLQAVAHPGPLRLHLAADDLALLDDVLKDRFGPELEWTVDPQLSLGRIRVSWPGGGIERLTAARHEALHAILDGLSASAADKAVAHAKGNEP